MPCEEDFAREDFGRQTQAPSPATTAAARAALLALLAQHPTTLTELKVKGQPYMDLHERLSMEMMCESYVSTVLDGLAPGHSLSTLELNACVVAPAMLSHCLRLRQLTSLDLSQSVVAGGGGEVRGDAILRAVATLTALTSLSVRDFGICYTESNGTSQAQKPRS